MLAPVGAVHVEHPRRHDEHPDGEIYDVQHVIEDQGLLHARSHQKHHQYGDDEREEIRRMTCKWNKRTPQSTFHQELTGITSTDLYRYGLGNRYSAREVIPEPM